MGRSDRPTLLACSGVSGVLLVLAAYPVQLPDEPPRPNWNGRPIIPPGRADRPPTDESCLDTLDLVRWFEPTAAPALPGLTAHRPSVRHTAPARIYRTGPRHAPVFDPALAAVPSLPDLSP